jgi:copper(I)-binding protein
MLLSGCAAGEHAGTSKEVPVVDAGSAKVGPIGLNAVSVIAPASQSYAAGSDARLQMYLTNSGDTDDQLLGVTTAAASSVQSFPNLDAAFAAPSSSAASSDAAAGTGVSTDGQPATSAASSAAASGSTAACAPVDGFTPVTVAAGSAVPVGYTDDQQVLMLQSLKSQLFPAQSFPVTFVFCHAGNVTMSVPVALTPGPSKTPSVDISPTDD